MQSEEGSCRREQLFSNKEEYWGIKKKKKCSETKPENTKRMEKKSI